jgi:hypothetical protein
MMFDWLINLLGTTPFDAITNPHPYPMIRSGGIFLIFIGIGMVIGAIRDHMELRIVGVGVALTFGAVVYNATALDLIYTLGTPSEFQNALLVIAVNIAAIGIGIWSFVIHGREGVSRRFMAGLLVILNLSFLIMIPAQGWVLVVMAVVCIAWALWALRRTEIGIHRVWLVDGLLKIAAGLVMVIFYPV